MSGAAELQAPRTGYASYDELQEAYFDRGWTDGLPIVPPTPEKVAAFLDRIGLAATAVVGEVPARDVTVTAEHVAINAVMAGCKRDYMPVALAAAKAMLHPDSNPHTVTATLAGVNQMVVINGPVRRDLDVNCGLGCFGPGWRANATIGRALRLMIRNACGSIPGGLDRAIFSSPSRYSFCFGENEEESPWTPLHVQRGLRPQDSAVTVYTGQVPFELDVSLRHGAEGIVNYMADVMIQDARPWARLLGARGTMDMLLVVAHDHMRFLADEGWDKARISRHVYERMAAAEPGERMGGAAGDSGETRLRFTGPEGVLVVAAGGAASPRSWLFPPHCGLAVTQKVDWA